jgi:hypothetical protein
MKKIFITLLGGLLLSAYAAAEPTVITLTEDVLVGNVERLGVHFSGDNFYDSVILKRRVAENFEGTVDRLHAIGPADQPEPKAFYSFNEVDKDWIGCTANILGGPDQWKKVKVVGVEPSGKNKISTKVLLDQPVRWSGEGDTAGILLENSDLTAGQHPWLAVKKQKENGKFLKTKQLDPEFCSVNTTKVVTGDIPEGTTGAAALELDGRSEMSFVKFRVQFWNAARFDGDWTVKFWARAKSGSPMLTVKPTVAGTKLEIQPASQWRYCEKKLKLEKPSNIEANPIFMLQFEAREGVVLLDEIELFKDGDGKNPTPFRDELVSTFQALKPGSVRYLRNVRDSYLNSVMPRIKNYSQQGISRDRDEFGTHEFYQFCQYIGANPWATVPGTFLLEEVDQMMEYHAAPATVGAGKIRAQLGQEKPWTEVFDKIHIQFGNEAITFFGTGYYGPDYWQSLVRKAKASRYYNPDKFVFHVNEQGSGSKTLAMHPAFDCFTLNGYHIFALYDDQIKAAKDLPGFYDWVFASDWQMWMDDRNNKNSNNLKEAKKAGKEISIYEGGNYHTTFGDSGTPIDKVNQMIVGRTGGMAATHTMLLLLKHWGARTQQSFNLSQLSFKPAGSFGNLPGQVRVWGGVLNIGNPESRRFRPRFLALQMANQVMCGDLIKTVHSGSDPKFSVTNRFGAGYGPSKNPKEMTVSDVPRIHSYGFKEGNRRGLILVSNDPRNVQPIVLKFGDAVKGKKATIWLLDSEGLEDSNETDWAPDGPRVKIVEKEMDHFESGCTLDLPPATMMAIQWTTE